MSWSNTAFEKIEKILFGQKVKRYFDKIISKKFKKGIDKRSHMWYTSTEKEAERSPFSPCRLASMVQYSIYKL